MTHNMFGNGDAGDHAAAQTQSMDRNFQINRNREQNKGYNGSVKMRTDYDHK